MNAKYSPPYEHDNRESVVCYPEEEREAVADAVDEQEEGEEGTEATTEHGRSDVHHRLLGALCGEHLVSYHYMYM